MKTISVSTCLAGLLLGFVLPSKLLATTYTWGGSTSNSWTNTANWSPSSTGHPDRSDNVVIPNTASNWPQITGTSYECQDLTFISGGGTSVRMNFNNGAFLNVYGSITNGASAGVMGNNSGIAMLCTSSPASPSIASIAGSITLTNLTIDKTGCTGYTAVLNSGSTLSIKNVCAIRGCELTNNGIMILKQDTDIGTAGVITEGYVDGDVNVRAIVGNCNCGLYIQRYHFLGNPLTDSRPYNHLDNWVDHTPAIERDFDLFDPTEGTDYGHHMYNAEYSYPPVLTDIPELGQATLITPLTQSAGRLDLTLPYGASGTPILTTDCEPWPRYIGAYVTYYTNQYGGSANTHYLNDLEICNEARTSQTPYLQFYDESKYDVDRPNQDVVPDEPPAGEYGYSGFGKNEKDFEPLEGMMAHFGPVAERSGDEFGYIDWVGEINDGTITNDFTRTDNDEETQDGYNLVGNPYPSPIDAKRFYETNSGAIESTVYIWEAVSGEEATAGAFVEYDVTGHSYGELIIPTGSAFFVRLSDEGTAELTMLNSHRVGSNNYPIQRKAIKPNRFRFTMESKIMGRDYAAIEMGSGNTVSFVKGKDADKMMNPGNSLCLLKDNRRVSNSRLPFLSEPYIIPLETNLRYGEPITFKAQEFTIDPTEYTLTFHDKFLKKSIRIDENFSYTFPGTEGSTKNRFSIEVLPAGYQARLKGLPLAFSSNYERDNLTLRLQESLTGPAPYRITDLSGRILSSGILDFMEGTSNVTDFKPAAGVYTLAIQWKDRPTQTNKVVVNR